MILNSYLDKINEQFVATIAMADVKGTYNNTWVTCYRTRCRGVGDELDKYSEDLCKSQCRVDAANRAISNLNSLKSSCSKSSNPSTCLSSISKRIEIYKKKINNERETQRRIKIGRAHV